MTLALTVALGDYEHTRDLRFGVVRAEGIDLTWLNLPVEEVFYRFIKFREFDVSEISFAKYVSLRSQGDESFVGLPVFPSRVFRLSSIYVRPGDSFTSLSDLRGARIGVPEWAQTAAIYSRGYLVHETGIPLESVRWTQAGVNQSGRVEKVALALPKGVQLQVQASHSLNDLLLEGKIDAIMSARPPRAFTDGSGRIVRLVDAYRSAEEAYFRKTGIFPIMHLLAMRRDVYEKHPWAAMNLVKAFEEAKARCLARLSDFTASHLPLPWNAAYVEEIRSFCGDDPFPYGLDANRTTLNAFLQFAFEQGVCHRKLAPEELFPEAVRSSFKV